MCQNQGVKLCRCNALELTIAQLPVHTGLCSSRCIYMYIYIHTCIPISISSYLFIYLAIYLSSYLSIQLCNASMLAGTSAGMGGTFRQRSKLLEAKSLEEVCFFMSLFNKLLMYRGKLKVVVSSKLLACTRPKLYRYTCKTSEVGPEVNPFCSGPCPVLSMLSPEEASEPRLKGRPTVGPQGTT